ncbi:hypothetical protein BDV96DRAFT_507747 [Lophiotrema nucula]|uniref:Methyltransferase n=1 Tax=Lophiotrema nucula TaxID=690887 RepID=A0A6A5YJF4_9PLEO|nr:hypothetical protein BDV96DRAFT_507747 [Lophiotrema nucula]
MLDSSKNGSVEADIQYLLRDPKRKNEKLFYRYFDEYPDMEKTNTAGDLRQVTIRNARHVHLSASDMFSQFAFAKFPLSVPLSPEEYYDSSKVKEGYYPKCIELVRSLYPDAARIEVQEHGTRKRDPSFPNPEKERHQYSKLQPSDYTHIDWTVSSAEKAGIKTFGDEVSQYRRLVAINIWQPIRGPVQDWPLALLDRRTIDYPTQSVVQDVIADNFEQEILRIYYDPGHEWYYWEELRDDEAIVFVQSDSDVPNIAGVLHTAFKDSRVGEDVQRRESVEVRVFVYFD